MALLALPRSAGRAISQGLGNLLHLDSYWPWEMSSERSLRQHRTLEMPRRVDLILMRDGQNLVVVVQIAGDHGADGLGLSRFGRPR